MTTLLGECEIKKEDKNILEKNSQASKRDTGRHAVWDELFNNHYFEVPNIFFWLGFIEAVDMPFWKQKSVYKRQAGFVWLEKKWTK